MAGPSRDQVGVLSRRATVVAAAVRAAYAWSRRSNELRAFDEVARMTGVIMHELGPGRGPMTPYALVQALRQPLKDLLGDLQQEHGQWPGGEVDHMVLLTAEDALSSDAFEIGNEFVVELLGTHDPGKAWMPSWSWMRAEAVESELFSRLVETGDPTAYTTARRFIVEYPAGHRSLLAAAANECGAERVASFVETPADQVYEDRCGRWWWPCPVCRWPMHVDGAYVRCSYRPHHAVFQVRANGKGGGPPHLMRVDVSDKLPRRGVPVPKGQPAEGAVQVEPPVWRYVVVPGATEVRIATVLEQMGAKVALYPNFDRYDIDVSAGHLHLTVDVKEHATAEALVRHLHEKPVHASHIVVPETHIDQLGPLSEQFARYVFWSERNLISRVRAAVRRAQ